MPLLAGQPPSGGCVLKQILSLKILYLLYQPPSGGCVLKLLQSAYILGKGAASRLRAAVC